MESGQVGSAEIAMAAMASLERRLEAEICGKGLGDRAGLFGTAASWWGSWGMVRTMAGFENWRVNRSLVISKSSSSNPRLSGDFVSSCCVFTGSQDGSMESALFGRRSTDSS